MEYEKEIIYVLSEAGKKGLSIKKIARHIYNNNNSLFDELSFEDVHKAVAGFLQRNCKRRNSLVERTQKNGTYRIRVSVKPTQLQLYFKDDEDVKDVKEEEYDKQSGKDNSLSLFQDII
ncbi:MAG: hypothetical protein LUC91_00470 [Prevotella sp.]|nr:hypothetical protein [Prevotella sp.]